MPDGPGYLPRSTLEAFLWITGVLAGAMAGRFIAVYVYHYAQAHKGK